MDILSRAPGKVTADGEKRCIQSMTEGVATGTMRVRIIEKSTGEVLADAREGQVQKVEGNWYFDPSTVNPKLQLTQHDYTCPYKGTCYYADFVNGSERVPDIAWVYGEPKSGWEHIKGRFGFYAGDAKKTREEVTE